MNSTTSPQSSAVASEARARLEAMYRGELKAVYGFLWRLGAREKEMEDLAHDVFLTAARRLDTYDPGRPARPWLLGIAFRVFSQARQRKQATEELPEVLEDTSPGPEAAVALRQARALLQRALESLPEVRRATFVLHELEGLSVNEIAEAMETPAPTIYSRLKLARDEVAQAVARLKLAQERQEAAR